MLNEGLILDHDGNMVAAIHVDFGMPSERPPIGAVVKYGQAKYVIEHSGTIQLRRVFNNLNQWCRKATGVDSLWCLSNRLWAKGLSENQDSLPGSTSVPHLILKLFNI